MDDLPDLQGWRAVKKARSWHPEHLSSTEALCGENAVSL